MNKTIKLIFRNLFRNPVTSFINLFGLAVSLTLVIILAAYTYSEYTTDKFHDKHKNISLFLKSETGMWTPAVLKTAIEENVSGIDEVIRISETWEPPVFQTNNKQALKSDLIYSDKNFFDFFDYDEVEGNLSTALEEPMKIAISKDLANRLFGNERAVGKTIKLNNEHTLTVSAVFKQQKTNSFLSFNAISNISTRIKIDASPDELSQWGYNNYQTFIMTQDGSELTDIAESIVELVPEGNRKRYAEAKLLPLEEIFFSGLKSSYTEYFTTGNKSQVLMLVIVAALVLIIALVNFINISSSQWHNKIKQTGILKIVGARKFSIVFKMLFETAMLFSIALLMALGIIRLIISFIFNYTAIQFDLMIIYSASFIGLVLLLVLAAGVICGIVPALQIASSDAIVNLKKKLAVKRTGSAKQGALVAFQFVIAIVLIAFTLLVQKQVDFGSSNLGINQNNIVGIQLTPQLHKRLPTLKNELETQSGITKLSFTQFFPGNPVSTWGRKYLKNGEEKKIQFSTFSAESSLFDLMDIELLSGRFYNSEQESDKNKVVVNEQFLKQLNIENPVGGVIPYHRREDYEIVGVIKDFNYRAVNVPIGPLVIRNDAFCSYALMEINATDFKTLHTTLENVKTISANLSPAFPVEFSFFDRAIENMYQSEVKFRKAFTLFSLAAILISCLGILAMSLFATQNRIKEIGVRKVNGANISEILTMLNKDFVKWVAIAFVIACPIAWYTMAKWLENFAYKTTLSWWIFALAGLLALGIALLTVSWQSWRAATRNPVEALRYE